MGQGRAQRRFGRDFLLVFVEAVAEFDGAATVLRPSLRADVAHGDGKGDDVPCVEGLGQACAHPLCPVACTGAGQVGQGGRGGCGDLGCCCGLWWAFGGFPAVGVAQRFHKVADYTGFAVDLPAVHTVPAVEDEGADLLIGRVKVPAVDLGVGFLDPAGGAVLPGLVLVGFGDVDGQLVQVRWDSAHKIAVGLKVVGVLREGADLAFVEDEGRVGTMAVGVQGDAVTFAGADLGEDVFEILDPVALRVARIGGVGVPRADSTDEDAIFFVFGDQVDGVAAESVAAGVAFGRDGFAGVAVADGFGVVAVGQGGRERVEALGQ